MKVALVHDYLTTIGGAERVVEQLVGVFDDAPVYTSVVERSTLPAALRSRDIRTTFLQSLGRGGAPLITLAPLMPAAFGRLDLDRFDVVLSSSSGFAHHVRVRSGAVHLCYCHTPPRFLWEPAEYFHDHDTKRSLLAPALAPLRRSDLAAARRVHGYVAISRHIAARIGRVYGIEAPVVYPPVDTAAFCPSDERSGRFLVVSRLRNYKRLDLAIEAANLLGQPLDVIGAGPELARLRTLAGPTVRVLGWRTDEEVRRAMARCTALIVPGEQDFGLTIVEAQASGRPPIAFGAGGALEIVRDGETGFLFGQQTVEALAAAMVRAIAEPIEPAALVASARRFDTSVFATSMLELIDEARARARTGARDLAPAIG